MSKDKNIDKKTKKVVESYKNADENIPSDVQGSYTGVNESDEYEKPVQDADDL